MGSENSRPVVHFEDPKVRRSYSERRYWRPSFKNVERYILIWFTTNSSTSEDIQRQNVLHSTINPVFIFDNLVEAERTIKMKKNNKIFVLINGDIGLPLIRVIQHRCQVAAIYVYGKNILRYYLQLQPIKKVQYMSHDFNSTVKHLKKDLYAYDKLENTSFVVKLGFMSDLSNLDQYYLKRYWRNFYDTELSEEGRMVLLQTYREYYEDNHNAMNMLHTFEQNIGPDTAIKWYVSEPFIYRLLNAACQPHHLAFLSKFQYLIRCIYTQLISEHSSFIQYRLNVPVFSVYCGRLMATIDFKRFRTYLGKVIHMTSFLVGSLDKNKTIQCINRCEPSENEIRVLFKLNIDIRTKHTQPYANISQLINDYDEYEMLIMFGASFHVMDIVMSPHDPLPLCILELCGEKIDMRTFTDREQRWYSQIDPFS